MIQANLLLMPAAIGDAVARMDQLANKIQKTKKRVVRMAKQQRRIFSTIAHFDPTLTDELQNVLIRSLVLRLLFHTWRRSTREHRKKYVDTIDCPAFSNRSAAKSPKRGLKLGNPGNRSGVVIEMSEVAMAADRKTSRSPKHV
mmetsp:Transcript_31692/g.44160  ORF Transcript_31692/g.44160 Transcript_31692/m.44160 type:complete len:143 (+) Transcript_31692:3-431(+)